MNDELSLVEAHRITTVAEERLRREYPGADITIHEDPVSIGDE